MELGGGGRKEKEEKKENSSTLIKPPAFIIHGKNLLWLHYPMDIYKN